MWAPLHVHSDYSFLDGLSTAEMIRKRVTTLGYKACALTDHRVISGVPALFSELRKAKVKPIAGCEFDISRESASVKSAENRPTEHLVVLAKNLQGWRDLIWAVNFSNRPENFYYKARLSLEELASFCTGNWILFSGHMGSQMANVLFEEPKIAYRCYSEDDARKALKKNYLEEAKALALKFCKLFGKENFFMEIQLIDRDNLPAAQVIGEILREVADKLKILRLATADSHYPSREDAIDQRILVASALKTTLPKIKFALDKGEDVQLGTFFRSNNYHIPSYEDLKDLHTPQEIENALKIAEICEDYSLKHMPYMPRFTDGGDSPSIDKLKAKCREGWKKRIASVVVPEELPKYTERIKMELGVIEEADLGDATLADYFLIVQDYAGWAHQQGALVGERGSGAGCLTSYLTGITTIDPVKFDLIFERFYASSRNVPAHVSFEELPFFDWEALNETAEVTLEDFPPINHNALDEDGLREVALLKGRVIRYYKHIYENIELAEANPQNSRLMHLWGKTGKPTGPLKHKEGETSLPDIDIDFPVEFRERIIDYLRSKYGADRVAKMATFGRLQGRGALKEVLRVHGKTSFEEMNRITEFVPDESAISDDLQEMEELKGESSIILWALQHRPEQLKEWCYLEKTTDDSGKESEILKGPLAFVFAQAMRLEGVIKSRGCHASGVVITSEPIAEVAPLIYDSSSKELLVGVDMRDAEDIGLVKFDILGSLCLDEMNTTTKIIRTGRA